jgi:hypothetical protein
LLVAAERLADEFGERVALEAVMAALERRLAGFHWTDSAPPGDRDHDSQPVHRHLDESGPTADKAARAGGAAYGGRHDQLGSGRVNLRSLLSGRRSSEELIDEDKALDNCKPLSTAVLSVSREHPRPSRFAPRSTPESSPPVGRQDALRAPTGDGATSARSSRLPSSLAGSSAGPNPGSRDDTV